MATQSVAPKQRFLEHVETVQRVEVKHDDLAKQRSAASRRQLADLYRLFADRSPSTAALKRWLKPPTVLLTDFKLFKLHEALTIAIANVATRSSQRERRALPTWVSKALGVEASQVDRLLEQSMSNEAMSSGRGPSAAAIEFLALTERFGSERTIWRYIRRHREAERQNSRRPSRPRRPVPPR